MLLHNGLIRCFLSLIATFAHAENSFKPNIFFGFDFVLHPIGVKWACGGEREKDLKKIEALIVAFPEQAERAELRRHIETLSTLSDDQAGVLAILGAGMSRADVGQLCAAALPLNLEWLTPQAWASASDGGMSESQRLAWLGFYQFAETIEFQD